MKMKKLISFLSVAFLVMLAVAETASAEPTSMFDFVIFSGGTLIVDGGYETEIGGHTVINGDIGSNQDLFMQGNPLPNYPAQLNGSAYAGRHLTFGQELTVGSSSELREVVANSDAAIGGNTTIWGTLDASNATLGSGADVTEGVTAPSSKTFTLIDMPDATTFTAGGTNQTVDASLNQLTLAPGTYGTLATSRQNQTVNMSSGNYYLDAFTVQGGFTLEIDLTSGGLLNLYSAGDLDFTAQNIQLKVKGNGTAGAFVPINDAPDLASLIYFETHGDFNMGGENLWGGTVYASKGNVNVGQYIDFTGGAYAFDTVDVADHGTWNHVEIVPEPISSTLFIVGGATLGFRRFRKNFKK
jgi:hypothetical protein